MKTRSGFVSNSSSSSFIIKKDTYKNIFDIAKTMILVRGFDKKEIEEDDKVIEQIKNAEQDGKDPNTPIAFVSINYNTFIVKGDDYYFISTCHNHSFANELECLYLSYINDKEKQKILEETQKLHIGYWSAGFGKNNELSSTDELCDFFVGYANYFWWPEFDWIGKSYNMNCEEADKVCHSYHDFIISPNNEIMCLTCNKKVKIK